MLGKEVCHPAAPLHLSGKPVTTVLIGGSGLRRKAAATLCVVMLLVAGSVQVMHHCTALEAGIGHMAGNDSLSSSPALCSICMTVQVATLAVIVLVLAIARLQTFAPALPSVSPPDSNTPFSLYVRPPPALFL
jgi:hypothetical protein